MSAPDHSAVPPARPVGRPAGRFGRWAPVLAVTVPALALAAVGVTHPHHLTVASAPWWTTMHILLLAVFPLLGVAHWILLRGRTGVLAWTGRIAAFGYIVFYGALDAIAGVGNGVLVQRSGRPPAELPEVGWLFGAGNQLGTIGSWCFLVASAATAAVLVRAYGGRALAGGAILLAACVPFLGSHIYWPAGVLTMCGLALGLGLLAAFVPAPSHPVETRA
ncbi:hypothetical protein PS9374_01438 [Planomonospora sphaerica]|uniref:Integral membrane protein n=1 Tax=Planomonospora sphaerica TaxID=161355 RepID=A0A171BYL4_9ACTN|nr:hypothetical protein [Planomonospora sphaerica]GAT65794.1 hypothetical protein PS9374_01438 [Planomonospora sphaerica]